MSQAIHLVAVGARTPVGTTAEASAAAARARISRLVMHPFMADQQNENVIGGLDTSYDPGITGPQRLVGLAHSALDEVVRKLLPSLQPATSLTLLLALPEARPGFDEAGARQVIASLESIASSWEPPVHIESFGRGHAGGLEAMAEATRRIRDGKEQLLLVGGVDSYFDFDTLDWLQEHRQLLNKESRSGFPPGEAAGVVALCADAMRRKLKLESLGTLRGSGVSREDKLIKTNDIVLGVGLSRAIAAATATLRLPAEAVDAIYCDINGERYRAEEWGFVGMRLPTIARDFAYELSADSWGDLGAASGPVLCNLALQAWARGYARGPRALVWCGSESGQRGAVVLEAPGA